MKQFLIVIFIISNSILHAQGNLNYSKLDYWIAHPLKKDKADSVPSNDYMDNQAHSKVDVFFIYPTIYNKPWNDKTTNASVYNLTLNNKIANSTILNQASIFNGVGKVYSPLYRQANLKAYFKLTKDPNRAKKAFDLAYSDVKDAFLYYLKNWNNGRPFIIASHSQGTTHAKVLIKELIEGTKLEKQMIVAYLVGIPVNKNYFKNLQICELPSQINCYCSWRTFKKGYYPKKAPYGDSIAVTNPLNWTTGSQRADYKENEGSILWRFKISKNIIDAQNEKGMVWVGRPKIKFSWLFNKKNWHVADYNFFWHSVRKNAALRAATFLNK